MRAGDVLDGGDVIPGFQIPVQDLFDLRGRLRPRGRPTFPMAQLTLFEDEDRPPQAARLGPRLRALADQGIYFGTSSWKYEGWLGRSTAPGATPPAASSRRAEVRGRMPGRVRRDLPGRLRRLQLLPVPHPRLLETPVRRGARVAPVRLQGPRGDHRRDLARHARYGTRAGQSNGSFLDARIFERQFAGPLAAVPRPGRDPDLRVRDHPAKSTFATAGEFAGRLDAFLGDLPGRLSLCGRDPQPRVPRPGLLRHARRATASPTSSTPGRGCRRSPTRSSCPGPSRPTSRSSAPCCARADLRAGRQPLLAVPGGPASPTRPRATAMVRIADRMRAGRQTGLRVRQQPPRGPRADDHRGRGRIPRVESMKPSPASTHPARARPPCRGRGEDRMILLLPTPSRRPCASSPGEDGLFFPERAGKALQWGAGLI